MDNHISPVDLQKASRLIVKRGKMLLAGARDIAAASAGVPAMFEMSPEELGVWAIPSGVCLVSHAVAKYGNLVSTY